MNGAVIYLRVSTDRQAGKDLSLPTQREACKRFAEEQGLSVVQIFEDAGESARTSARPAFLEMIDFCLTHAKTFDLKAVICWDTSRFARNRYDAILYKKQLEKKGIKVLFASQLIGEGAEGELLEGFLELVDEFYSKHLSRNIVRGMEENARRGFLNGCRPPFGYRIIKVSDGKGNLKGKLEMEDSEADIVRTIFRLYLDGYGFLALADELVKRGIKSRNGKPFYKKTIENTLGNPVYVGTLRFQKICIENVHSAIISKEMFEEVQRVRQARNPERVPGRQQSSPMLFSGLLFCGACGQKLTFERAFKPSKAYTYYSCSSFKSKRVSCPERLRFDADKLDHFLLDKIAQRILDDKNIEKIILGLLKLSAELLNQTRSQTLKLQREVKGVEKKIDNLVNAVADGILPRDIVKEKVEKFNEDKRRLELQLARGRVLAFPKLNVSGQFIQNFRDICKEVILTGSVKRRQTFIKSFVKKIDLTRNACKVTYDLAHLLAAQENGSTLGDELVEAAGIEPASENLSAEHLHT